jgi:mRNA interferase MazF
MANPLRGEVWLARLDPIEGHEQGGTRPVLVLSADQFNRGPASRVVAIPITSTRRGIPWHVDIDPPEGGLQHPSTILCDQLRTLAKSRFAANALGKVSTETMLEVEGRLRMLLQL